MILSRRAIAGVAFASIALMSLPLHAFEKSKFDKAAFDAALAAGKPILVEVTAPWCPTCKAQAPILGALKAQPSFKSLVSFDVDFDSQKDVLKEFKVQTQSTLIVFKGGKEVGRSTGDTNKASIEALVSKAL